MADRTAYNTCMKPYMTGAGKSREERNTGMCIGAKLCTGKAKNEDEALKLCQEASKQPKPEKARKGHGKIDPTAMAQCIIAAAPKGPLTVESLAAVITRCSAGKAKKPQTTKKRVIACVKAGVVTGTNNEIARLYKLCSRQIKEEDAGQVTA